MALLPFSLLKVGSRKKKFRLFVCAHFTISFCAAFIWSFTCEWTHRIAETISLFFSFSFHCRIFFESIVWHTCRLQSISIFWIYRNYWWWHTACRSWDPVGSGCAQHSTCFHYIHIHFLHCLLLKILLNEHLFNINWISLLRSWMWLVHKSLTLCVCVCAVLCNCVARWFSAVQQFFCVATCKSVTFRKFIVNAYDGRRCCYNAG